jgi:glycosyltransferase involved in cell wall biosynthesis
VRIVIDALPVRGTSLAVVLDNLLAAWVALKSGDDLVVVTSTESGLRVPAGVQLHEVDLGSHHYLNRLRAQNRLLPRLCRSLGADALLAILPTTCVAPLPCPRIAIVHDLRYSLRPDQFPTRARLLRSLSYGIGYRQADGLICISDRTRGDLLAGRPWLAERTVAVAHHGADHVRPVTASEPYAVAFGQHTNKNVALVLGAWAELAREPGCLPLRLCGIPAAERDGLAAEVAALGLSDIVQLLPWLPSEEFDQMFGGAELVVFPSDFEGFGLPAVEAMRLGVPVVISADPALAEVTAGLAVTMSAPTAHALAEAVREALGLGPDALAAAAAHAAEFTWARTVARYREVISMVGMR